MLRTSGLRGLSRVLTTSIGSIPQATVVSSQRWLHASHGHLADFGIATGAEREELEWREQGKVRFDLTPPRGPIGTKEAPMVIESNYDERIVGCCGGVGEDEHDTTWFLLEKGKTVECLVCNQVFKLKVTGVGGKPGHDEHH
ncbi:hypothetical protein M758_11G142400 [Ceratodon purpureus]|uniref:Uncharacterized protein n=1 Tax=Ceratodon purpureus TaxID=3225 RepID=A0A8T0GF65_CERPU|nr:hypothetical protein KC19_11G146700 [Ceratodon purpureus]KAG0601845.1 hypothetical protein M758_11G142400 [Ceratodon purpureus]